MMLGRRAVLSVALLATLRADLGPAAATEPLGRGRRARQGRRSAARGSPRHV